MPNPLAEASDAIDRARAALYNPGAGSLETAQAEAAIASAYALTQIASTLTGIEALLKSPPRA